MEFVTNIGTIALTDNQIRNWAPAAPWVRFSYIGGEVLGVSEITPLQADIDALKASLAALPDTTPQSDIDSQNQITLNQLIQLQLNQMALAQLQSSGMVDTNNVPTDAGHSAAAANALPIVATPPTMGGTAQ